MFAVEVVVINVVGHLFFIELNVHIRDISIVLFNISEHVLVVLSTLVMFLVLVCSILLLSKVIHMNYFYVNIISVF